MNQAKARPTPRVRAEKREWKDEASVYRCWFRLLSKRRPILPNSAMESERRNVGPAGCYVASRYRVAPAFLCFYVNGNVEVLKIKLPWQSLGTEYKLVLTPYRLFKNYPIRNIAVLTA